jgi:hypothetical protein
VAWGGAGILAVLALLVQWPLHDRMLVPMDEGHLLQAADSMLRGSRLYVDLHTGLFPGIYLAASGLLASFGRDALVLRWAAVIVNIGTTLALWAVARRMVARHWAPLAPLLYLALLGVAFPVLSMFNYSTLAVFFGLSALSFLLRYLEGGRSFDGALLGLCVAAAVLSKQNFGALSFAALLIALFWNRRNGELATRSATRILMPIAISGGALTALVLIYFALEGSLSALLDSTIFSLAGSQLRDFNNPIPPLFGPHPQGDGRFLFLYLPPALFNALIHGEPFVGLEVTPALRSLAIRASYGLPILALVLAPITLFLTRERDFGPRRSASQAALLFAVIFFPGIFPSAIFSHLAFVLIPTLLLFAYLADRIEGMLMRRNARHSILCWRAAVATLGLATWGVAADSMVSVVRLHAEPLGLDGATLKVSMRERQLFRGAVDFIDGCADPGEPILVLPDIPAVYFLANRPNPSPHDLAIPGRVDGNLIARRADEEGVRCAVFNPRIYPEFPPFKRLFPGLARYLEKRFGVAEIIRGGDTEWLGMIRRGREAPGKQPAPEAGASRPGDRL